DRLDVDTFEVQLPHQSSTLSADQANIATLENQASNGFGLTLVRDGNVVSNGNLNSTINLCSANLDIVVPLKARRNGQFGARTTTLKIETISSDGQRDDDLLRLVCKPGP
ncbi:MAG: hypothetical protein HY270_08775, partial [Deltaproteobacteria bacterium]|nr:hypothetical protein [Deltaproteobacteria bacterium]